MPSGQRKRREFQYKLHRQNFGGPVRDDIAVSAWQRTCVYSFAGCEAASRNVLRLGKVPGRFRGSNECDMQELTAPKYERNA